MGMLPKNGLRRGMTSKLRIYPGPNHPHEDHLPFDTAENLLMPPDREFIEEDDRELKEIEEKNAAEFAAFQEKAYAWQMKTFGRLLSEKMDDEESARLEAENEAMIKAMRRGRRTEPKKKI